MPAVKLSNGLGRTTEDNDLDRTGAGSPYSTFIPARVGRRPMKNSRERNNDAREISTPYYLRSSPYPGSKRGSPAPDTVSLAPKRGAKPQLRFLQRILVARTSLPKRRKGLPNLGRNTAPLRVKKAARAEFIGW